MAPTHQGTVASHHSGAAISRRHHFRLPTSQVTTTVGLYHYPNQQTSQTVLLGSINMITARKRKDARNPRWASRDKDKIRVIEHSRQEMLHSTTKQVQPRTTPAGRTFTNIRKGSIKIFSLFRGVKSK
jgi:hypothetical protein